MQRSVEALEGIFEFLNPSFFRVIAIVGHCADTGDGRLSPSDGNSTTSPRRLL
jgi:hypothetical protein